mmetsp:Transcript_158/g.461  ORF Transcript_158/g.461 Transcript_158/m.461 type:complete len:259 (+) Transcript_158:362-1138(+)
MQPVDGEPDERRSGTAATVSARCWSASSALALRFSKQRRSRTRKGSGPYAPVKPCGTTSHCATRTLPTVLSERGSCVVPCSCASNSFTCCTCRPSTASATLIASMRAAPLALSAEALAAARPPPPLHRWRARTSGMLRSMSATSARCRSPKQRASCTSAHSHRRRSTSQLLTAASASAEAVVACRCQSLLSSPTRPPASSSCAARLLPTTRSRVRREPHTRTSPLASGSPRMPVLCQRARSCAAPEDEPPSQRCGARA